MALYHKAAYTLEPEATITDPAPLSAGNSEAEADQIVALSAAYAPESKIAVTLAYPGGHTVEVTLAPVTAFAAGYQVDWNWGDGVSETADPGDLVQGHDYAKAGTYRIEFVIRQPGRASIGRSLTVVAP